MQTYAYAHIHTCLPCLAASLCLPQITQQLEGICLQVIGLVLQKPIIGMAGVCEQLCVCLCLAIMRQGVAPWGVA